MRRARPATRGDAGCAANQGSGGGEDGKGGESGEPCEIWVCESCGTSLWSRYHVSPGNCRWVRGGTLDDPTSITPDVHIWTRSKMPFVTLPDDVPVFATFYDLKEVWSAESLDRLRANIEASKIGGETE